MPLSNVTAQALTLPGCDAAATLSRDVNGGRSREEACSGDVNNSTTAVSGTNEKMLVT